MHQDNDGNLLAKVSDLGYAGLGSDSELIRLPKSRPWVDPNWNRRECTIQTAKKMDMYSFGMVCLWVLFRDQLLHFLQNCIPHKGNRPDESIFFLSNEAPQSRLESLQESDQLAFIVETMVKTSSFLKGFQRSNLATFFQTLLCKDLVVRQSDWKKLVELVMDQAVEGMLNMSC